MKSYLVVCLGGGLGAAARHGVNRAALLLVGPNYPAGTLFANIAGCFVMGLLLTTGVLGGLTTFSAFALETGLMWERHDTGHRVAVCGGVGDRFDQRPLFTSWQ